MLHLLGSRLFYPGPTGGVSFPVLRFRSHKSCCPPSFAPGSSDRLAFSSRHPSQACRPNEQNAPDTRIPLFWCPLFFRGFRQFRGSLSSSFSFLSLLRLISRCPRIWNPRSASLRCHPARVPIEAVSSSRPCFSSCRVSRANLATSGCPGGRNVSLRWRMGGLVLVAYSKQSSSRV